MSGFERGIETIVWHILNLERASKNYIASGYLPWNHPTCNKDSYDCADLTREFTITGNDSHREKDSLPWNTTSMSLQSRMQQPNTLIDGKWPAAAIPDGEWLCNRKQPRHSLVNLDEPWNQGWPTCKIWRRHRVTSKIWRKHRVTSKIWRRHRETISHQVNSPGITQRTKRIPNYHCPDLTCEITKTITCEAEAEHVGKRSNTWREDIPRWNTHDMSWQSRMQQPHMLTMQKKINAFDIPIWQVTLLLMWRCILRKFSS